jgi:hypothetical protein
MSILLVCMVLCCPALAGQKNTTTSKWRLVSFRSQLSRPSAAEDEKLRSTCLCTTPVKQGPDVAQADCTPVSNNVTTLVNNPTENTVQFALMVTAIFLVTLIPLTGMLVSQARVTYLVRHFRDGQWPLFLGPEQYCFVFCWISTSYLILSVGFAVMTLRLNFDTTSFLLLVACLCMCGIVLSIETWPSMREPIIRRPARLQAPRAAVANTELRQPLLENGQEVGLQDNFHYPEEVPLRNSSRLLPILPGVLLILVCVLSAATFILPQAGISASYAFTAAALGIIAITMVVRSASVVIYCCTRRPTSLAAWKCALRISLGQTPEPVHLLISLLGLVVLDPLIVTFSIVLLFSGVLQGQSASFDTVSEPFQLGGSSFRSLPTVAVTLSLLCTFRTFVHLHKLPPTEPIETHQSSSLPVSIDSNAVRFTVRPDAESEEIEQQHNVIACPPHAGSASAMLAGATNPRSTPELHNPLEELALPDSVDTLVRELEELSSTCHQTVAKYESWLLRDGVANHSSENILGEPENRGLSSSSRALPDNKRFHSLFVNDNPHSMQTDFSAPSRAFGDVLPPGNATIKSDVLALLTNSKGEDPWIIFEVDIAADDASTIVYFQFLPHAIQDPGVSPIQRLLGWLCNRIEGSRPNDYKLRELKGQCERGVMKASSFHLCCQSHSHAMEAGGMPRLSQQQLGPEVVVPETLARIPSDCTVPFDQNHPSVVAWANLAPQHAGALPASSVSSSTSSPPVSSFPCTRGTISFFLRENVLPYEICGELRRLIHLVRGQLITAADVVSKDCSFLGLRSQFQSISHSNPHSWDRRELQSLQYKLFSRPEVRRLLALKRRYVQLSEEYRLYASLIQDTSTSTSPAEESRNIDLRVVSCYHVLRGPRISSNVAPTSRTAMDHAALLREFRASRRPDLEQGSASSESCESKISHVLSTNRLFVHSHLGACESHHPHQFRIPVNDTFGEDAGGEYSSTLDLAWSSAVSLEKLRHALPTREQYEKNLATPSAIDPSVLDGTSSSRLRERRPSCISADHAAMCLVCSPTRDQPVPFFIGSSREIQDGINYLAECSEHTAILLRARGRSHLRCKLINKAVMVQLTDTQIDASDHIRRQCDSYAAHSSNGSDSSSRRNSVETNNQPGSEVPDTQEIPLCQQLKFEVQGMASGEASVEDGDCGSVILVWHEQRFVPVGILRAVGAESANVFYAVRMDFGFHCFNRHFPSNYQSCRTSKELSLAGFKQRWFVLYHHFKIVEEKSIPRIGASAT